MYVIHGDISISKPQASQEIRNTEVTAWHSKFCTLLITIWTHNNFFGLI